jgi:hypothetical protein
MTRTIISLTDAQARHLRRVAHARGTSMAAVIRDAIDEIPEEALTDRDVLIERALAVSGKYHSGLHDVSSNLDDYLVDAYLE